MELKRKTIQEEKSIVDEIIQQLESENMKIEDVDEMYKNGELSEEDYADILEYLDNQDKQNIIDELSDKLTSGAITVDDLNKMLDDQKIDQDIFDSVMMNVDQEIDNSEQMPVEQEEPLQIDGKFNNYKLFEKFIELKKYIEIYLDAYSDISVDQLTEMQARSLMALYNEVQTLKNNIDFYMEYTFKIEDYKKNLYSYLLFNKDFSSQISRFRNTLHLNANKFIQDKYKKDEK